MNRDAILATIIGFGVGLIIAGLVFLGPSLFKNFKFSMPDLSFITKLFQRTEGSETAPAKDPESGNLTVESPLADTIEPAEESLVSGTFRPEAVIVISGETDESVTVANNEGAFAGKITLKEGRNDLIVTGYADDISESVSVTVFYTPETF